MAILRVFFTNTHPEMQFFRPSLSLCTHYQFKIEIRVLWSQCKSHSFVTPIDFISDSEDLSKIILLLEDFWVKFTTLQRLKSEVTTHRESLGRFATDLQEKNITFRGSKEKLRLCIFPVSKIPPSHYFGQSRFFIE